MTVTPPEFPTRQPRMSVARSRELLGAYGETLSDAEMQRLIDVGYELADAIVSYHLRMERQRRSGAV